MFRDKQIIGFAVALVYISVEWYVWQENFMWAVNIFCLVTSL